MTTTTKLHANIGLALALPATICFRVTRRCNARCGFCLAPPDGTHPSGDVLRVRIDWLAQRGVRAIHFCGGEPSIHPALAELVDHVRERDLDVKLTTNAIRTSDELVDALQRADAEIKVSLHGEKELHDALVGVEAFERTLANLRRYAAAGLHTSVQTTVVAGHTDSVERVARLALDCGVRRMSVLPFLPRGDGLERRGEFELSSGERRFLRAEVARLRRELAGLLELRWLDFTARPIHVVESDGRVVLEGASESLDVELARIDGASV